MFPKLNWKKLLLRGGAILLALTGLVMMFVWWVLPGIIESSLANSVRATGLPQLSFEVRRIGLSGADVSAVLMKEAKTPFLRLDSVRVDYSLVELVLERRLKKISLGGMELNCSVRNGQLSFPGFELKKFLEAHNGNSGEKKISPQPSPANADIGLPFSSLEIRSSTLFCNIEGREFSLPFELDAGQDDSSRITAGRLHLSLKLRLMDQDIEISALKEPKLMKFKAKFLCENFDLSRFQDIITKLCPGVELSGAAKLAGDAELEGGKNGFELKNASFGLMIYKLACVSGNLRVGYEKNEPFGLGASLEEGKWKLTMSSFVLDSPVPLCIERCGFENGKFEFKNGSLFVNANWLFKLRKLSGATQKAPVHIPSPVELRGRIEFEKNLAPGGDWDLSFKSDEKGALPLSLNLASGKLESASPQISAQFGGSGGNAHGKLEVSLASPSFLAGFGSAKLASFSLLSEASIMEGAKPHATFELKAREIELAAKTLGLKIPQLSFIGAIDGSSAGGLIKLSDGSCRESKAGAEITGISAMIPFAWPVPKNPSGGLLSAEAVKYRGILIGAPFFTFKQDGLGFSFDGEMPCDFAPGLSALHAEGRAVYSGGVPNVKIRLDLPEGKMEAPLKLENFVPALAGFECEGKIDLEASLEMSSKLSSTLALKLDEFRFSNADKSAFVEGVKLQVQFPSLHTFRSARKQELTFSKAAFGNFAISNGRLDFQVESFQSFFMENLAFEWCGGSVYCHAMRFAPGGDDYRPILYCDRVKLAAILNQFGIGEADGDGSLSGRIPLSFVKGKLAFDKGFLYSSPGEGGSIRLKGLSYLTEGLPKDSPQFSHLSFSVACLDDFTYKWARLMLDSDSNTEMMKIPLQLMGKPNKPIPFKIDNDTGMIVHSESLCNFQEVRLDPSFNSEFNDLMSLIKQISSPFNKMKDKLK